MFWSRLARRFWSWRWCNDWLVFVMSGSLRIVLGVAWRDDFLFRLCLVLNELDICNLLTRWWWYQKEERQNKGGRK
jgi:hypothetical protein